MQLHEALFLSYLLFANLAALICFGLDKLFALRKRFRIPEAFLLAVTLFGGAAGSLIGMVLFHHKIRKPKFRYTVPMLFLLYLALLLMYFIQSAWGVML